MSGGAAGSVRAGVRDGNGYGNGDGDGSGPAVGCEIDHLVVAAHDLAQGVAWCEAALGVAPGPGGRHAFMGTHNRLLAIGGAAFPRAYLEIIAIDPDATAPARPRWFGLDDPVLQQSLQYAPQLLHVVVRTPDITRLRAGLVALGLDPGEALAAERDTPQGRLAWRILVRADGSIACGGALPTLIEWQGRHPAAAMAASPVALVAVDLGGLPCQVADLLQLRGAAVAPTGPALTVTLATPRGHVDLTTRSTPAPPHGIEGGARPGMITP